MLCCRLSTTKVTKMQFDEFKLDIESILDCPEQEELKVLQRLAVQTQQLRSRVAAAIETYLAREKEYVKKCEAIAKETAELHAIKKERITKLDEISLQQKVTDKKIAIATKQHSQLKAEIAEAKTRKESISLEMVDLLQEHEDSRKMMKDKWNAIKMACAFYKDNLNFHIDFKPADDHERLKVSFFRDRNRDKDNYYIILLKYKNHWKVGQIKPELEDIHLEELRALVDITKPLDTCNVTACLCKLRNIFREHYLEQE